jgi:hypothetical protein
MRQQNAELAGEAGAEEGRDLKKQRDGLAEDLLIRSMP